MKRSARDNQVVHGMWVGSELSRLELLTLHSFTHFGHAFHLWVYDEPRAKLPSGVTLRDASKVVPRDRVFRKAENDPETGVGRGSYGAPFSDLFRYKLLYEHGGIWVDMDVTCLRTFDFAEDYVLRPHRVGVVGSILKCPKGSRLMRRSYEETVAAVNEASAWLMPNRILSRNVERLDLGRFIKAGLSNVDSWLGVVRRFVEEPEPIPDEWYAIHWINEMWRTLGADGGYYRGRKLLDYVPDKDAPRPGSTMWELYRKYGLIDPWEAPAGMRPAGAMVRKAASSLPVRSPDERRSGAARLNVLVPSLVRGGAERAVIETMTALRKQPGLSQRLYVVHRSRRQYPIGADGNLEIVFADSSLDEAATMRAIGMDVLCTGDPTLYTHLVPAKLLRHLWDMGVTTIPVVQNASQGWTDPPSRYRDPHVPFVVAVSDAVAEELRASASPKPVMTIRHQLQRFHTPAELSGHRREIRERHGIADNALLIGMVGQFKSQKAYTRAVRVLERVRQSVPAKLMILGGWDQDHGAGRAAYEATCRRAVELGVIADMIMPGDVHPADPYFAAFDVFMNTSIYEGLSVALLEALQAGCPVVVSDAGGNREVLGKRAVLVKDGADIDGYVEGILSFVHVTDRVLPQPGGDAPVAPRLWPLLSKHGMADKQRRPGSLSGSLFLTQNLQMGGPQQSLVNLLTRLPARQKTAVCALEDQPLDHLKRRLDEARIPIFSADRAKGVMDKVEAVLDWVDMLRVRNLCYWNVGPELKLALTKILSFRDIRLIDVSPGPMLFDELAAAEAFQRQLAFSATQYFSRLDRFVAKYTKGVPAAGMGVSRRKIRVIPNGVPTAPNFVPLPPAEVMLPRERDPRLAVGTCCRIVPDKHIEFLLEAMALVSRQSPGSSLTIVGGPDLRSQGYFDELKRQVLDAGTENVFFVGEQGDIMPFLGQFQVFVMFSDRQGCPNASLEAMSMGLPIVANRSGGMTEQVEDGVNGYLVKSPQEMADRILALLKSKRLRERLGKAGRKFVRKRFSAERMAAAYEELLDERQHFEKQVGIGGKAH
jgi:glycosyltransferase involved in cell wall biosynthesis